MFERFTDRARRAIVLAQEEARLLNHNHLGTEHLLLGLIHQGDGVAAKTLESLGISLADARTQVEVTIGRGSEAPADHIPFTPRAKKVLELSLREAQQLGHNYIGTEHILLGLVREADGVAALVLRNLGTDLARVRQQVIQLLSYAGAKGPPRREGESAGPPFTGIIPAPCSFCGTRSPNCGTLFIGSSGALICEHCVAIAVQAREDAPYTAESENGDDGTE